MKHAILCSPGVGLTGFHEARMSSPRQAWMNHDGATAMRRWGCLPNASALRTGRSGTAACYRMATGDDHKIFY